MFSSWDTSLVLHAKYNYLRTNNSAAKSSMFPSSNKNQFFVIRMELQPAYFHFSASLLQIPKKSNESVDSF